MPDPAAQGAELARRLHELTEDLIWERDRSLDGGLSRDSLAEAANLVAETAVWIEHRLPSRAAQGAEERTRPSEFDDDGHEYVWRPDFERMKARAQEAEAALIRAVERALVAEAKIAGNQAGQAAYKAERDALRARLEAVEGAARAVVENEGRPRPRADAIDELRAALNPTEQRGSDA